MVDALTPFIVGRRPNTYTLTKALAEFLLVRDLSCLHIHKVAVTGGGECTVAVDDCATVDYRCHVRGTACRMDG